MNSYYYLDAANQQQGPLDGNLLPSKGVTAQTLVCANGMAEWTPAGQVAELQPLFAAQPPATPAQPAAGAPAKPNNHLVWAILSTVFSVFSLFLICCNLLSFAFGIIGIINAIRVDNLYTSGHYAEAQAAAKKYVNSKR